MTEWENTMKKSRKIKVRKTSVTVYMKMLQCLRNSLTSEYSRVLREETKGIILGYDWVLPRYKTNLYFPFCIVTVRCKNKYCFAAVSLPRFFKCRHLSGPENLSLVIAMPSVRRPYLLRHTVPCQWYSFLKIRAASTPRLNLIKLIKKINFCRVIYKKLPCAYFLFILRVIINCGFVWQVKRQFC